MKGDEMGRVHSTGGGGEKYIGNCVKARRKENTRKTKT
jgi:hypothetical protein